MLSFVVDALAAGEPLPEKYKDHNLTGNYKGCRECHITPDRLLIYEVSGGELILYLTRTGIHSDLFLEERERNQGGRLAGGELQSALPVTRL